jgi:hypothetical protein
LYTGGAIGVSQAKLTLVRNVFTGNESVSYEEWVGGYGGAIYIANSSVSIQDNVFDGNYTELSSGALHIVDSSGEILRNRFIDNVAPYQAGAIYLDGDFDIRQNVFISNASFLGGALAVMEGSSQIEQNVFLDNVAYGEYWDPGAPEPEVLAGGGGIYLYPNPKSVLIRNNILANNSNYNIYSDGTPGAGLSVQYNDLYTTSQLNHNLGTLSSTNLMVEPQLLSYSPGADPSSFDLHLQTGSPLVGMGDAALTDADGSRSDMGLYGGEGGDQLDRDGDGVFDYFWPGTRSDAPSGFDPADWDADDSDPTVW